MPEPAFSMTFDFIEKQLESNAAAIPENECCVICQGKGTLPDVEKYGNQTIYTNKCYVCGGTGERMIQFGERC